jgi:hypothetical protein
MASCLAATAGSAAEVGSSHPRLHPGGAED